MAKAKQKNSENYERVVPGALIDGDLSRVMTALRSTAVPRVIASDVQELVLALVREGATLTAVCRRDSMPSLGDVWHTCEQQPEFAALLDKARALQAASRLDRAVDVMDAAMAGNDLDEIRGAAVYGDQTVKYAEKIAPRNFGQLVKLAGADAGALTVQVMDYSNAAQITGNRADKDKASRKTIGSEEAEGEG